MKTEFKLEGAVNGQMKPMGEIQIIGKEPKDKPYVAFRQNGNQSLYIPDKDLELFAVNILKALKSNKLK